jgi:N-acetylmuramoyl-L-alanine amidase
MGSIARSYHKAKILEICGDKLEEIKKGFKGSKVVDIQRRLRLLGYNLAKYEIDGIFGLETIAAIKKFQQDRGLLATGIVDEETWQELVDAGYKIGDRLLYLKVPPLRGDDVKTLQSWLKVLGFYTYNENGIFHENTHKALIEFQKNMNLPADGIAGETTLQHLRNLKRIIESRKSSNYPFVKSYKENSSIEKIRVILDYGENIDYKSEGFKFYKEKIYICKSVVNFCRDMLLEKGIDTLLTVNDVINTSLFLNDRIDFANKSDAEILISVNPASSSDLDSNGSSCFYFQGFKSYSISGKRIANLIQDKLVHNLNLLDCRVHGANFAILKETKMTAVVVEPAFISNQKDRNNLKETSYQMGISSSIANAVLQFLNE